MIKREKCNTVNYRYVECFYTEKQVLVILRNEHTKTSAWYLTSVKHAADQINCENFNIYEAQANQA